MTVAKDRANGAPARLDEKQPLSFSSSQRLGQLPAESECFLGRANLANNLSYGAAFAHMAKAMLGTGLLALPLAFKHSGLYLGLILSCTICCLCLYCMRQVVRCAHHICNKLNRSELDYAGLMRHAVRSGFPAFRPYAVRAGQLVNANIFVTQFGFCCVYFVFMGDNLQDFFENVVGLNWSVKVWMCVILVPVLVICSVRHLKALVPLAYAANVLYVSAVCIVLGFFIMNLGKLSDRVTFGELYNLPLFFGTVMFAFEGISVIMPIENRMRNPQDFVGPFGVLNVSCAIVLILYALIGFLGYLSVGENVADSVTLNLPPLIHYEIIKLLFVVCVLVGYPIQFYVIIERVESLLTKTYPQDQRRQLLSNYAARYVLVIASWIAAMLVPYLALFIALIGAFSVSFLGLVFPPIIELLVHYDNGSLSPMVWMKNLLLLLFALVGFGTGTYASLHEILKKVF